MSGSMSPGGGSGTGRTSEANTWQEVQVFERGIRLNDSQAISSADGSDIELGAADEGVRVMGELDVFSTTCTIRNAFYHRGSTLGFFNTSPVTKESGVAVTAGGIHAALVRLGLFAA